MRPASIEYIVALTNLKHNIGYIMLIESLTN